MSNHLTPNALTPNPIERFGALDPTCNRDQATDAAILQSTRHSTRRKNERKRSSRSARTRRPVFCSADSRSLNSDSSKLRMSASEASSRGIIGTPHSKASATCVMHAKSLRRLMRNLSSDALVGMLVLAEVLSGKVGSTLLEFCRSESWPRTCTIHDRFNCRVLRPQNPSLQRRPCIEPCFAGAVLHSPTFALRSWETVGFHLGCAYVRDTHQPPLCKEILERPSAKIAYHTRTAPCFDTLARIAQD